MRLSGQSALRIYVCPSCRYSIQKGARRAFSTNPTVQRTPDIYDVVCVGGGPAGLALVAALRKWTTLFRPYFPARNELTMIKHI